MATVSKIRKNFNPGLQLLGVIINAYESNPVITRQIMERSGKLSGKKSLIRQFPESIRIEEAIASKSGVISRPRVDGRPSKAAEEVKAIGEELLSGFRVPAYDSITRHTTGQKTLKVTGFLEEFEKDDIKKNVDIVELFAYFNVKLSKVGKNFKGLCPWHNDSKTPSLSVDQEKGLYNCFGCGEAGDAFDRWRK